MKRHSIWLLRPAINFKLRKFSCFPFEFKMAYRAGNSLFFHSLCVGYVVTFLSVTFANKKETTWVEFPSRLYLSNNLICSEGHSDKNRNLRTVN